MILLKAEGREPVLSSKTVPNAVLYVQTTGGTLQALDAETGKTIWIRSLGKPGEPAFKPAANDQYVAAIRGSKLYLLDRSNGELIYHRNLDVNPIGATLSKTHIFVPALNGQVLGLPLPTEESDFRGAPPWVYQSGSRITAMPLVTDSTVSWGTRDGLLFAASLDGPRMLYRHIAGGAIYGAIGFVPPNQLIVSSADGIVSALEQQDGLLQWEFSAGEEIYQAPIAHRDRVYAVTQRDELLCLDTQDGSELWIAPRVSSVLSVGERQVYGRDPQRGLTAVDRKTGARRGTIPTLAYESSIRNTLTDRIYLLSDAGSLLCLREIGVTDPVIQFPLPQPPSEGRKSGAERADEPAARANGENVFGEEAFGDEMFDDEAPEDPPADEAFNFDDAPADGGFDFGDAPADEGFDFGDAADDAPADDAPADDPPADDAAADEGENEDPFAF